MPEALRPGARRWRLKAIWISFTAIVASKATELKDIDYEQKSDAWFVLSELQLMKKDMAGAELFGK